MPRYMMSMVVASLLALAGALQAQVASGPAAGTPAPALKVLALTGVEADEEIVGDDCPATPSVAR